MTPPYPPALVQALLASHRDTVGRALIEPAAGESAASLAQRLYDAPFAVLAHDAAADPLFTYANLSAQRVFERPWDDIVGLPSRLSAEAPDRDERARLLARVAAQGWIGDYSGIRIARSGRRFRILNATVWNLHDPDGRRIGQAATFAEWAGCD